MESHPCSSNSTHVANIVCDCEQVPVYLCDSCIPKHLSIKGVHNLTLINSQMIDEKQHLRDTILELKSKISVCKEVLLSRFRSLEEEFRYQIDEFSKLDEALVTEEEGSGVGLVEKKSDLTSLFEVFVRENRINEVFQFDMLQKQPNLSEALGVTWKSMIHPKAANREEPRGYPKSDIIDGLIAGMKRHRVPMQQLEIFRSLIREKLNEEEHSEEIANFCRNLHVYLHEAPSDSTLEALAMLLPRLRSLLSPSEVNDWRSVGHILTRKETLPANLTSLAAVSNVAKNFYLAEVRNDHLRLFDCKSEEWRPKLILKKVIQVSDWSASTMLPSSRVFVCGGHEPDYLPNTYELNPSSGSVSKLSNMINGNSCHALQPYFSYVYSFGGFTGMTLSRAEKYSLTFDRWTLLANMLTPRRCFTPCLHRHRVYLCGGADTNLSEEFDPVSEEFSPLSFLLPESYDCRAVIINAAIIAIGERTVTRVDLEHGNEVTVVEHPPCRAYGVMTPVTRGNKVWYNVWENSSVVRFDVEMGAPEVAFKYPG